MTEFKRTTPENCARCNAAVTEIQGSTVKYGCGTQAVTNVDGSYKFHFTCAAEETIVIKMTCHKRWVPEVLSMLKHMEHLGDIGASRVVALYCDGDGDFRPKFELPEFNEVKPVSDDPTMFDAG